MSDSSNMCHVSYLSLAQIVALSILSVFSYLHIYNILYFNADITCRKEETEVDNMYACKSAHFFTKPLI